MMMQMQDSTENLTQLAELLEQSTIKTVVTKSYSLAQARDAWIDIMSGHTRGKIVLEISGRGD